MKKQIIILIILSVILISSTSAVVRTSVATGNWNTAGTWNPSGVPTAADSVIIQTGHTITLDANGTCGAITINGTLIFSNNNGRTLTVTNSQNHSGNVLITNSGTFTFRSGANNQLLNLYGSFYCYGTLNNLSGGSGSSIIFLGSGEKEIYSNASIRILNLNNSLLNLTAQSNLTITTSVVLNNGRLNTNNYVLTLNATATIGTTGSGRIEGTVTKNITSGTSGIIRLMSVNNYINIQTTPNPTITSITIKSYPNTQPPDVRLEYDPSLGVNRYYEITNITGTGLVLLRLDYLASEMGGSFVPTSGNIWQYRGTEPWVNQGGINQANYYTETPVPISGSNLIGKYAIADAASAMPVQLAFFVAYSINQNEVKLEWETVSEINNYGFFVERYNPDLDEYITIEESFQPGAGTTLIPQKYSWIDENFIGNQVEYRLLQIDLDGLKNYSQPIVVMLNPNSTGNNETIPAEFILNQNYPNPFNPTTKISFSLAKDGFTTLKIYNLLGEEIATLFSDNANAGKLYTVEFNGNDLPSGIYISRLQNGSDVQTRKMILMK